jgi:hypothetical protein
VALEAVLVASLVSIGREAMRAFMIGDVYRWSGDPFFFFLEICIILAKIKLAE